MPTQCEGFKFLGYKPGEFPNAEYIGDNGLHFGIHQGLEKKDLDFVLNVIKDFLSKNT
jgi:dTDP-4-amino-4,6-dideoxygalactose transaminase